MQQVLNRQWPESRDHKKFHDLESLDVLNRTAAIGGRNRHRRFNAGILLISPLQLLYVCIIAPY
jgi:hypothetical protein